MSSIFHNLVKSLDGFKPPRPNGCRGCWWYVPSYRGFEDLYPEPPECKRHPQYMNLKTFPFRNRAKCWEEDKRTEYGYVPKAVLMEYVEKTNTLMDKIMENHEKA